MAAVLRMQARAENPVVGLATSSASGQEQEAQQKELAPCTRKRRPPACVDLYTAPSLIEGANQGLFTRTQLPKGTCLGYYTGTILGTYPAAADLPKYRHGDYFMELRRRPPWVTKATWAATKLNGGLLLVDGTCRLSFANCCKGDSAVWNCDILMTGAFVTNRRLLAGEEIVVHYGPYYWDKVRETTT